MAGASPGSPSITYRLTEQEMGAFTRALTLRQSRATGVRYSFGAIVLAVPVIGLLVYGAAWAKLLPAKSLDGILIVAALAYFLGFFINHAEIRRAHRRAAAELFRGNPIYSEDRRLELATDGARVTAPSQSVLYPYAVFTELERRDGLLVAWLGAAAAVVVPLRAFPDEMAAQAFEAELRRRLQR